MTDNYRTELVQIAAVCLAAAQVAECDTTSLGNDNEGVRGRFALERLLNEVRDERRRQELKRGTRTSETAKPVFWLAVLGEEVGEVAEEITSQLVDAGCLPGRIVLDAIALGKLSRAALEA